MAQVVYSARSLAHVERAFLFLRDKNPGAAQDAGGPQGPPAALRRATASTGRAPHYHDVNQMIMMMIRQLETDTHADRHTDSDRHHRVRRLLIIEGQSKT
jgi:hypothetical protein